MAWLFKQDEKAKEPPVEAKNEEGKKAEEKTPAELIAESLKPVLEPLQAEVTKLREKFEALEQAAQPKKPAEPTEPAKPVSVLDDEDAAFNQRNAPLAAAIMETKADLVRGEVKAEYGELWTAFSADIEESLNKSPVQFRANREYVRNCVDMIIGRKARAAGYRFDTQAKRFFLEDAGGGGGPETKKDDSGMTEKQKRVFERMGVPLDKARETMKKLEFVQ